MQINHLLTAAALAVVFSLGASGIAHAAGGGARCADRGWGSFSERGDYRARRIERRHPSRRTASHAPAERQRPDWWPPERDFRQPLHANRSSARGDRWRYREGRPPHRARKMDSNPPQGRYPVKYPQGPAPQAAAGDPSGSGWTSPRYGQWPGSVGSPPSWTGNPRALSGP